MADTTLAVERVGAKGYHYEHPDAFSAADDADPASAPSLHLDILRALEADMRTMKIGTLVGRAAASSSSSAAPSALGSVTCSSAEEEHVIASPSEESLSCLLQDLLGCFVLRRTKDAVDLGLPLKTRVECWVDATPTQARVLETLRRATLLLIGPESVLGRSVLETDSSSPDGVMSGASMCAPASPCFVGEVCSVIPPAADTMECLATITSGRVGNASGKLLMLLRKAALHPLLLRTRFGNERVLAVAALVFEASLPQPKPFESPEFACLSESELAGLKLLEDFASASEGLSFDAADAALVELHRGLPRGALMFWAESALRASQTNPQSKPPAKLVVGLADLAESFLHASVSLEFECAVGGLPLARTTPAPPPVPSTPQDYELMCEVRTAYESNPALRSRLEPHVLSETALLDSGKVQRLAALLEEAQHAGSRVLVFSQFNLVLDIRECEW